jgi:2-hydroxychromene-2-carboxylate isomerase
MAGSSTARSGLPLTHHEGPGDGPRRILFVYDLASPDAYLAAERVLHELPEVPEWVPVLGARLAGGLPGAWRCAEEETIYRERVERRAAEQALQPVRWPDPFPFDSELAMRVATYAKGIGKGVAFSLAAFRQAFAAGRDLGVQDNVLVAAAACEMHPTAVLKGAALRSVGAGLERATADAAARGVTTLPALVVRDSVTDGERLIEDANAMLTGVASR